MINVENLIENLSWEELLQLNEDFKRAFEQKRELFIKNDLEGGALVTPTSFKYDTDPHVVRKVGEKHSVAIHDKKKVFKSQVEKIIGEISAGLLSVNEIALKHNVSVFTVYKYRSILLLSQRMNKGRQ